MLYQRAININKDAERCATPRSGVATQAQPQNRAPCTRVEEQVQRMVNETQRSDITTMLARYTATPAAIERAIELVRADITALTEQQKHVLSELKSARARAADLEWELEDTERYLHDLEAQREGPVDRLLEREIGNLHKKLSALEEQVLGQLLQIDSLTERYAAHEHTRADRERLMGQLTTALQAALEQRQSHGSDRSAS